MDESAPRAPALSALKAAQASLAEGLTRLRVASTARPPTPSVGEGESVARGFGALPLERGEAIGGSLLSCLFFPGGLSSGASFHGDTILPLASTGHSFTVIPGLEDQVTSPLSSAHGELYEGQDGTMRGEPPRGSPAGRFGDLHSLRFGDPHDLEGVGFEDARDFVPKTGDTTKRSGNSSRLFTVRPERGGLCLYGPHNPGSRICGGVIARGAQGQFPDRFCLKTDCRFTTHTTKSYLPSRGRAGRWVGRVCPAGPQDPLRHHANAEPPPLALGRGRRGRSNRRSGDPRDPPMTRRRLG